MKTNYFLYIFLLLLSFSCSKEQTIKNAEIKVEFNDDVSPIRALFKIDEEVIKTEWIINDSLKVSGFDGFPKGEPVWDYVFNKPGEYKIKLLAGSYDGIVEFEGITNFVIPKTANKLIVFGINFHDQLITVEEDSLILRFKYVYNSEIQLYEETKITSSELKEMLNFRKELELSLPDIYAVTGNFYLDIDISGQTSSEEYFNGTFWLKDSYFGERIYKNSSEGEINDWDGGKIVTLNLDWTYE